MDTKTIFVYILGTLAPVLYGWICASQSFVRIFHPWFWCGGVVSHLPSTRTRDSNPKPPIQTTKQRLPELWGFHRIVNHRRKKKKPRLPSKGYWSLGDSIINNRREKTHTQPCGRTAHPKIREASISDCGKGGLPSCSF